MDYNGINECIMTHCWKIWRRLKMLEVSEFSKDTVVTAPIQTGQRLFCGTSTAQTLSTKPLSMLHANPYPKLQNQPPNL